MAASRAAVRRHVQSGTKSNFNRILTEFETATKAPEQFISPQGKVASNFTNLTKHIFDSCHQQSTDDNDNLNVLSELIVENFDDEQVWQEIELHNEKSLKHSFQDVAKIIATKDKKSFYTDRSKSRTKDAGEEDTKEEVEKEHLGDLDYSGSQDLFPEMQTEEEDGDGESNDDDDDADSETNFDIDAAFKRTKTQKKKSSLSTQGVKSNIRTSVVDDRFFKLSEMERFLELEDAREERRRDEEEGKGRRDDDDSDQDGEEDDDDESIDFFQELPSDEDEELDEEDDDNDDNDSNQEDKDAKEIMYSDFFLDPEDTNKPTKEKSVRFEGANSDDEEEEEEDEDDKDEQKDGDDAQEEDDIEGFGDEAARKALMGLLGDSDGSDEGEDARDILGGGGQNDNKSKFEKRQERLKQKIQQLEEVNLATKPWQLSGEITSGKRPSNSLLEEDLDFDATAKAGVEVTEETTKSLEDIIRQRILDVAYDDVERKEKPKEELFEFKKRVTLDQEKSKVSLAEIYEQEYIKQTQGEKEEKQDPAHVDIKNMMDSLFLKLDALSNFHYTPKPAIPEVKIVSNLPSITMEEVAPVTTTDATLLAPEEIQEKKQGELKGDTERTDTDKKHARRKKKTLQRIRVREKEKREKLVEKLNPGLGNKYSKQAAMAKLEKSSKVASSRTTIIKEGKGSKKSLTSSKSFFTQLQEEVSAEVHGVKTNKNRNKDKKQMSASKLKL